MTRELELLERLVAFRTVSHESNLGLIEWAQNLLKSAGFETTRIPGSDVGKAGLHARIGPWREGGVCLSGHTDVVPVDGQIWTSDPFTLTRAGACVVGRGTTDMKGFVACALALAERTVGVALKRPLSLVLSFDEEVGCGGLREMLPQLTPLLGKPEMVIVGEPTAMQIATGHKGKTALEVSCRGEAGHSALAPLFANAIHLAARFVDEIRNMQAELAKGPQDHGYDVPYSTVHVGRIIGGRALNIVPDRASIEMELRYLPQVSISRLLQQVEAIAARAGKAENCPDSIRVKELISYPGLVTKSKNPAIALAQELAGGRSQTKVAFGTEAGFFAELGLNTVVVGPGDMAQQGHKPDEAIALGELEACRLMMDNVLQHLAG